MTDGNFIRRKFQNYFVREEFTWSSENEHAKDGKCNQHKNNQNESREKKLF